MRRSTTSRRPSRAAALLPAPRQSGRRRGVGRNATPPAAASSEVVAAETAAADRGRTSKVSSTARQPRSNAEIRTDHAAFEHRRQVLPPGQAWLRWTDGRIYHVDVRRVAAGAAVPGRAEDNGSGSSNSVFFHVHYRGWHARRTPATPGIFLFGVTHRRSCVLALLVRPRAGSIRHHIICCAHAWRRRRGAEPCTALETRRCCVASASAGICHSMFLSAVYIRGQNGDATLVGVPCASRWKQRRARFAATWTMRRTW
jgi:hypothetical protein